MIPAIWQEPGCSYAFGPAGRPQVYPSSATERQLLPLKIGGDSRCVGRPPGVIRRVSKQQGRGIMLFTHVYAGVRTKLAAIREKESFY